MTGAVRKLTRKDVEEHNSKSSTWLVMDNKVYDVTPFLEEHPGGIEVLLENAGKDATENFDDVGHSADAKEIREQYLIGEIVEQEKREYPKRNAIPKASNISVANSTWSNLLIPVGAAIVVLLSYRLIVAYIQ